jgi:hypothetical protein
MYPSSVLQSKELVIQRETIIHIHALLVIHNDFNLIKIASIAKLI